MARDCSEIPRLILLLPEDSHIMPAQLADQHELVGAQVVRARLIANALHKARPHSIFEPRRAVQLPRRVEVFSAQIQIFQHGCRAFNIAGLLGRFSRLV